MVPDDAIHFSLSRGGALSREVTRVPVRRRETRLSRSSQPTSLTRGLMSTGTGQARTVAGKIGHQHRSDVLLHDLIRLLDSIAERREEYTSKDICQQCSDDTDT